MSENQTTGLRSSSSDDAFDSADKDAVPLDDAYKRKKIKCETEGKVGHVSREAIRKASLGADASIVKELLDGLVKPREKESRVMVLYSGGTIGMKIVDESYVTVPDYLPQAIRAIPHLHDKEYADSHFKDLKMKPYVLPSIKDEERRILYWLFEYDPLTDSSNMTFDDWIKIAKDIYRSYDEYDGFVILHGTDTLCYTASALSFLFENLGKPIILTGSQMPMTEVRSDGRKNFLGALIIAGNYDIPEVSVYFNNKLYRGNRSTKCDNSGLDAFHSPNFPPLASLEIRIHVYFNNIYRSSIPERVSIKKTLNRDVGLLRIFPSISVECVKTFLCHPVKGVILQTYGAGNIPNDRVDIIEELGMAAERGVLIVNATQCQRGSVDVRYHSSKILYDLGIVGGNDMTPEAALTKLAYVLALPNLSLDQRKALMARNLRGETTVHVPVQFALSTSSTNDFLRQMSKMLNLSTSEEMDHLRDALFSPLICEAASQGDVEDLKRYKSMGALLHQKNFEKRTALHIASAAGRVQAVKYLLSEGVSVHAKDDRDRTPLIDATKNCHMEIVKMLKDAGAHLRMYSAGLGSELCSCAASGDLRALSAWNLAGADLNTCDYDRRSALHVAATNGMTEIVEFLLRNDCNPEPVDSFGRTPLDNAISLSHHAVINILKEACSMRIKRTSI